MNGDEQNGGMQFSNRLSQYRRERRQFSILVYSLVTIAILLTVAQWIPFILFKDLQQVIRDHFWITLVGLTVLLLTVTMFIFWQDIRFHVPFNWIVAGIIVESLMIGLSRVVIQTTIEMFMICFVAVSVYIVLLIGLGIVLPHDMTLNMVVLFFCAVIFFIGSVFFVLLHIMVGVEFSLFFYVLFVIIIVTLFTLFHAQTIHGGRYAQMRRNDHLLAALIIYHDFMIIFMLSFYFLSQDNPLVGGLTTSTTRAPRGDLPSELGGSGTVAVPAYSRFATPDDINDAPSEPTRTTVIYDPFIDV